MTDNMQAEYGLERRGAKRQKEQPPPRRYGIIPARPTATVWDMGRRAAGRHGPVRHRAAPDVCGGHPAVFIRQRAPIGTASGPGANARRWSMKKSEEKTNAMRLLEQKGIAFKTHTYAGSGAISGMEVAAVLKQDPDTYGF